MASKSKDYGNNSISSIKGADRVRLRPAVIFGSDGIDGCRHSVFEIVSNAVDEAGAGYGNLINVTAYKDLSICVEDFGRGVPLGYNEAEGRYNWELVYCELYAGGKYNVGGEDSSYEFSLGLNGLGAASTQYASEYMQVRSYRDGEMYEMNFKKGCPVGELTATPLTKKDKKTGTTVCWKPDSEVFTDINVGKEYYTTMLDRQAMVNPGVKFVFRWENEDGTSEEHEYYYENGIADYIAAAAGETSLTAPVVWNMQDKGRDCDNRDEYRLKAQIAFCFSNTTHLTEYYHNSSYLEYGGSPDRAVRAAFTYAIDKYLRQTGKYTKSEQKISYADIADCLILIISSFSTQASYENQTKKSITNTFIQESLTNFMKENLELYFREKPLEAEKIASQVLINKRSREEAENTRVSAKKKMTTANDVTNRINKFVSCRSKDPTRRELYIVEGDSALTSVKLGRDAEFQAIIPVRGKTLNCLKSTYKKILESDIIMDLVNAVGCGMELESRHKENKKSPMAFDRSALRWSKIIICTDADEDGYQIRTLLLTLFYRLLPKLVDEGLVFIAESPLYEITCKDETYFAYDEKEKAEITEKLKGAKYTVQRSTGLGENEPDMMWKTTMNPATRRLIQICPDDREATDYIFDTLLGDNLKERKAFIAKNGKFYFGQADV